jgi:cellulose synthase/poly-beta-1,6-N-acetylglucosamine synthase-like glycosyltransferase
MVGVLLMLVFVPGIQSSSGTLFSRLVYANVFVYVSFYIISWISTIRKLAMAEPIFEVNVPFEQDTKTVAAASDLPIVFVIMPCHREPDESLLDSVKAVINADYPAQLLRFFLAFDGLENESSYHHVVSELGATVSESTNRSATATIAGVKIVITLFAHGGKPFCQSNALALVKAGLTDEHVDMSEAFLLLVDSDTRLAKNSIKVFAQCTVSSVKLCDGPKNLVNMS